MATRAIPALTPRITEYATMSAMGQRSCGRSVTPYPSVGQLLGILAMVVDCRRFVPVPVPPPRQDKPDDARQSRDTDGIGNGRLSQIVARSARRLATAS